ncbi:MAG TPA: hypothetical protein VG710_15205 [Opitutus sp.]|nr:hypothetical protein [Opitutus sp.]
MVTLIPFLLVSAVALYVFGLLRMITAALEAPIGYENAGGFHYGIEVPEPQGELVES